MGVTFNQAEQKWRAQVSFRLSSGQAKPVFLGSDASEEQAAKRASAGAYVLGDRCAHTTRLQAESCAKRIVRHGAHPADGLAVP